MSNKTNRQKHSFLIILPVLVTPGAMRPMASAATKARVCFQAEKRDILPFERKRKRKRPGGIFRVSPWEPQNSSHPHKGRASKRGTTAPLSKGAKGSRQQAKKRDGNKHTSKDKAEIINKAFRFAIKADGKKCRPLFANFNFSSLSRARKFSGLCPQNFSALFLDKTGA